MSPMRRSTNILFSLVNGTGDEGYLNTDEARLASLQDALKCGTNCGSCIPELKRKVHASRPAQASGDAGWNVTPVQQLI